MSVDLRALLWIGTYGLEMWLNRRHEFATLRANRAVADFDAHYLGPPAQAATASGNTNGDPHQG